MQDELRNIPGWTLIGRGINLLQGEDAIPVEVVNRGEDKTWLNWRIPGRVEAEKSLQGYLLKISEESRHDFQQKLSASLGLSGEYAGFRGDFESYFQSDASVSTQSSYALLRMHETYARLTFRPCGVGDLLPDVVADWDNFSNANNYRGLFKKYGTHIVLSVMLGGRMDSTISMTSSASNSEVDFGAQVKASYETLEAAVAVNGSVSYSSNNSSFESTIKRSTDVVGGNPALTSGFGMDFANYSRWAESVLDVGPESKGGPVPIGWSPSGASSEAFQEIWELAPDKYREDMRKSFVDLFGVTQWEIVGGAGSSSGAENKFGHIKIGNNKYDWYEKSSSGLMLMVLDIVTLRVTSYADIYYTYGTGEMQNALARTLDNFSSNDIVILVSGDSGWGQSNGKPSNGITESLRQAIDDLLPAGGFLPKDWKFDPHQPFAMIAVRDRGGAYALSADASKAVSLTGHLSLNSKMSSYVPSIDS